MVTGPGGPAAADGPRGRGVEVQVMQDGEWKPAPRALAVVLDADDDDDDGVVDAQQTQGVPATSLLTLQLRSRRGGLTLRTEGGLRLLQQGRPLSEPHRVSVAAGTWVAVQLQGQRISPRPGDSALHILAGARRLTLPVTVVSLRFLDAAGRLLDPARAALRISKRITNDASLPRRFRYRSQSVDPDNVRLQLHDVRTPVRKPQQVRLVARPAVSDGSQPVPSRPLAVRLWPPPVALTPRRRAHRSRWLRLVTDATDAAAPGVQDQLLRVQLGDAVFVRYRGPDGQTLQQRMRVGRPAWDKSVQAVRRAALRVRVLRDRPGGRPVIGRDEAEAVQMAREQVAIANEIWAQCAITFGPPAQADVQVVDPPPVSLLAVADGNGLPARGDGVIRLRVDGKRIPPVRTLPDALPVETALQIAAALKTAGWRARVTENPPTGYGAGASADVVVYRRDGRLAVWSADGDAPLSTDRRQH
ncbi:MAG: hypothetical protein ACPGUV_12220, partial [Polyangiales bacterium]